MMKVGIRSDGNTEMGYGHLTRSNAVATELLDQGTSVTYLTKTPDAASSVCADQANIIQLDSGTQSEVASKLRDIGADVAYMDLPEVPFGLQQNIRKVCPLAVFLGSARHRLYCDMLVNGHLFANEEEYEWSGEEPVWCLGQTYLPLRQPFPEIASREKDCTETPEQALILMGGTDPHNITPAAMEAFRPLEIQVTVIVGPGNQNYTEIRKEKKSLGGDFLIEKNPNNLPEQMFKADIAVSGFGTTIYELMATRTPFIGITRTEFERGTADRVANYVDIDYFGKEFNKRQLTTSIANLQRDTQKRAQLQHQYKELIDGQGSKRIARELNSLVQ